MAEFNSAVISSDYRRIDSLKRLLLVARSEFLYLGERWVSVESESTVTK